MVGKEVKTLWLSSPKVTFSVDVDEYGFIVKCAPICWRWKGKAVEDLIKYFNIDRVEEI